MKGNCFSLRKRLASFKYAFSGLLFLLKKEHNAWIHATATIVVIISGFVFELTTMEWALLSLTIGAVFAAEAFNTAIEKLADFVSPQHHPTIKIVKDVAAAGVLFTAIAAAIVGLILFLPKLL